MKISKFHSLFILIFCCLSINNLKAQDFNYNRGQAATSLEIYNYVTKGLEIQLKSGLDMKRGYFLWDKLTRGVNSSDGSRNVEIKALVEETNFKVCAWVMIYKNNEGVVKYFCIPTQASSSEVWDKCFADLRDTNLQTTAYLPITWALMNLVGQLTNDYTNICFPKGSMVLTKNMEYKAIENITNADTLIIFDTIANKLTKSKIKELIIHNESEYRIYKLTFVQTEEVYASNTQHFVTSDKTIEATPNHPILTSLGVKRIDEVKIDDEVFFVNSSGEVVKHKVSKIQENFTKARSVYNVTLENGNTFIVNGVVVLTK